MYQRIPKFKSVEKYIWKETLVVFSITENNKLSTEEVKVTIIATGSQYSENTKRCIKCLEMLASHLFRMRANISTSPK